MKTVHLILIEIPHRIKPVTNFGRFIKHLIRATNPTAQVNEAQEAELRGLLQELVINEQKLEDTIVFYTLLTSTSAWLNNCHE